MTDRATKISELPVANNPAADTLLVVVTSPGTANAATKKINSQALFSNTSLLTIPGPYASDVDAASANVAVGYLYYNAAGSVRIRLT